MPDHTPSSELIQPDAALRQAIAEIYQRDPDFSRIEAEAGELHVRRWQPTFASLVRIILGQQLSSKAAEAIFLRLKQAIDLTPTALLLCPEATLKQVGFSGAKIATCQRLATALVDGTLDLDGLACRSDADCIEQLTQLKGIGAWTAEIYLLFCLQRLDSFPASDLALQLSYQRLKHHPHRPTRTELITLCQPLVPWRGAVAHLLWHSYRHYALVKEVDRARKPA